MPIDLAAPAKFPHIAAMLDPLVNEVAIAHRESFLAGKGWLRRKLDAAVYDGIQARLPELVKATLNGISERHGDDPVLGKLVVNDVLALIEAKA